MQKRKNKKSDFEKKFLEGLKEIKNPIRKSIFISLAWSIAILIIVIISSYINGMTVVWNLNFGSSIGIVISIIWFLLKVGVGENPMYKFFNWKNKKLVKQIDLKKKIELTLDEYRSLNKQKSFIGIALLFTISSLALIITLMIMYI